MKKHDRIYSFDFIRALCAIGIIVFHFGCESINNNSFALFYNFVNGSVGNVIVNMFFILSGCVLYLNNNEDKLCLKKFYYKRFKSIFPMFYITFIVFYIYSAVKLKNPFYGGSPFKFVLTLFGVDGFLQYRMINYYQVGEWFLGAIVMIYAIYPLMLKLFKKTKVLTGLICLGLYTTIFIPDFWIISRENNFFACLISFFIGMILMHFYEQWNNNLILFIISSVLSIVLSFVKIECIPKNITVHILALSLFIVLSYIGEKLMKFKYVKSVFTEISTLSFAVFLLQHKVIYKSFQFTVPNNLPIYLTVMIVNVAVILLLSKGLTIINNHLIKSRLYKILENEILKSEKQRSVKTQD